MAELFGIDVKNEDEMDGAERHFTEAQWSSINGAMLPLQGIGENYFFLNESFARDKSILSFPTLYDYDFADYQFQEEWRKKDIPDYQGNRVDKDKMQEVQYLYFPLYLPLHKRI